MRKRRHDSMKKSPLWVKWKWTGNDHNRKKFLTCYQARRYFLGIRPIITTAHATMYSSSGPCGRMPANNHCLRTRNTGSFFRSLLNLLSTSFFVAPLPYLALKSCATLFHPYVAASFMATRYILCSRVHFPPWAIFEGKRLGARQGDKRGLLGVGVVGGGGGSSRWSLGCVRMEKERKKKKEKKIVTPFTDIHVCVCD